MPKELYGVIGLLSAVAAMLLLIGYLPPYSTIASLQVALYGTNWVTLSFLFAWLIVAAPFFAIAWLIEKRVGTRKTWFTPVWENLDRSLDLPPGKLLIVGITLLGMGAYFAAKDLSVGPRQSVTMQQLEQCALGEFSFVEVRGGQAMLDANISFKNNSTRYHYVPVMATSDRPHLFLRVTDKQSLGAEAHYEGMLERNAMEGELASQLYDDGILPECYYVLRPGGKPHPLLGFSFFGIGFSLSIAAFVWWRLRYIAADDGNARPPQDS